MNAEVIQLDVEQLPAQLRQIRSSRNITQRQLAERARVSQQTISAIEQGKMEPSLRILRAIAVVLGVALLISAAGMTTQPSNQQSALAERG